MRSGRHFVRHTIESDYRKILVSYEMSDGRKGKEGPVLLCRGVSIKIHKLDVEMLVEITILLCIHISTINT